LVDHERHVRWREEVMTGREWQRRVIRVVFQQQKDIRSFGCRGGSL